MPFIAAIPRLVDWLRSAHCSDTGADDKAGNANMTVRVPVSKKTEQPRAWQRMLSGRRLDLLDPSPLDIEIEDIAHGLARVARWNGQTVGDLPFNVAQHSLIVEEFCTAMKPGWPTRWKLAALLHDAPEFVIGDMISPFKAQLGGHYKTIEKRLEQAIHLRFSLPPDLPHTVESVIKRADRASAYYEATQLAGFEPGEARKIFGAPRGTKAVNLSAMSAIEAQSQYLDRFQVLFGKLEKEQS